MITSNDAEPLRPDTNRNPIDPVGPKNHVEPVEADRFSEMMKKEDQTTETVDSTESEGEMSPEELQRQISEGMFKAGFQKSMERAREIAKEMKQ